MHRLLSSFALASSALSSGPPRFDRVRWLTGRLAVIAIGAVTVALAAHPSTARADSREGFIAGIGTGPGFASVVLPGGERENHLGVASDITIGYAPTPRLAIYAMSKITWFQLGDALTFSEVAGLGVTYFLSPDPGAPFLVAGAGYAVFLQPGSDDFEAQFGVGGLLGVGYQPFRHWVVQLDAGWNKPGDFQSQLVMAKVNFLYN